MKKAKPKKEVQLGTLLEQVEEKGIRETALSLSNQEPEDVSAIERQIQSVKFEYDLLQKDDTEAGKKVLEEFLEKKISLATTEKRGKRVTKDAISSCVKRLIGEFVGTYFLAMVHVMVVCSEGIGPDGPPIATGLVVAVVIMTFGEVSGSHINLVVSLGFMMLGELSPVMLIGYSVSQIAGATSAAYTCRSILVWAAYDNGFGGMVLTPETTSSGETVLINAIFTFFLMLLLCHMACDSSGNPLLPLGVGLYVTVVLYATRDIGCSMNPSVAMGTAIAAIGRYFVKVSEDKPWLDLAYITIGSVLGTIVAVLLYRFVTTMNPRYKWPRSCKKPPTSSTADGSRDQLRVLNDRNNQRDKSTTSSESTNFTGE